MRDDLQGLTEPRTLLWRQGQCEVLAVMDQRGLATPDVTTDLDDLAGSSEGTGVGHPMKSLDHLRPRGSKSEMEAAVGERIDARSGHRDEGGGSGVNRQDGRPDLDGFGQCGQITHERRAIETVSLSNPDEVQPSLFHLGHVPSGLLETARVAEHCRNLHEGPFVVSSRFHST